MIRTLLPMACGGRFLANLALTLPALPWDRVTLPQTTRKFDFSPLGFPGTEVLFLACKKGTIMIRYAWILDMNEYLNQLAVKMFE